MKAAAQSKATIPRMRRYAASKNMQKAKYVVLGSNVNDGWLAKLAIYYLLFVIAYLYLNPVLYMVSTMFKSVNDLIDPSVKWFPRALDWNNLQLAWQGLKYPEAFLNTATLAFGGSIIQVLICACTGYALGRLRYPGKNVMFALVILTFLIPPQIIIIPLYVIYSKLGWLNTPLVFLIPALFGQGLRSALFIIIFRQFFKSLPGALEEAAKLDGASPLRLFLNIMLPLSRSACLIVFLFSFIWYWNMSYEPAMFLTDSFTPLSIRLNQLETVLMGDNPLAFGFNASNPITEGAKMGGAFLIILPPLLIYMIAQRWFVESVERTGLVE